MKAAGLITEKEVKFITDDLSNPRTPIFYGLPKIHKIFQKFPPLRPIVSHVNSSTRRLSEFIDSFLKRQAQLAASFVRDTKHFLQKLEEIKKEKLPDGAILVTMDVRSLYTNIDHDEGVQACVEKLEQRKRKSIPSSTLGALIFLVLKSNAFRFGHMIYRQVMGTAMGTPMAPNYANLFMAKFEEEVITSYHASTGHKPMVWFRYIDDIFLIWTHGNKELDDFISYIDTYSDRKEMKSTITFEVNKSEQCVNFLDVSIKLVNGTLHTSLFTKATDAHLYLNYSSNHPKHVLDNIPKGQFIRIRRICSEKDDYYHHSQELCNFFIKRGFSHKRLLEVRKEVADMKRDELLIDTQRRKKDAQTIFVCDWHPSLSQIPTILKQHYRILESDERMSNIFPEKPLVAYRRPRTTRQHLVRNDILKPEKKPSSTTACGSCKLCKNISERKTLRNSKKQIQVELKDGGTCRTKYVIYAAICTKCDLIYVGHTGTELRDRFAKHRHDIKKRPDNTELAEHFHTGHDDGDMEVLILESGIYTEEEREMREDRWICRLQTLQPTGINKSMKQYAKDMYTSYKNTL